jgi:hypothetical protein
VIHRHDRTLDEAIDLKRAHPMSRLRALLWAAVLLLLLAAYGLRVYQRDSHAAAPTRVGTSMPPASAPAGR